VRDGENGFLVRDRDPGLLADRLEKALSARWDPESIAARSRRSWAAVAEEQVEIYRRVVAERAGAEAMPPARGRVIPFARAGGER
jgi:glycosyltransferase involved in cell wall biosynthesis